MDKLFDPTALSTFTYSSGELVDVEKSTLRKTIAEIETQLGFEHKDYDFKILFLPKAVQDIIPINASVHMPTDTFTTPKIQHIAVLHHEGTHYVMGKNGLLFGPKISEATIYDRLVDETVAELTTSERYGYSEMMKRDIRELYHATKEVSIDQMIQQIGTLGDNLPPGIKDIILAAKNISMAPIEIAVKHKDIEERFAEYQEWERLENDVNGFYAHLDSMASPKLGQIVSEAIRTIAVDNAKKLAERKFAANRLVEAISNGVKEGCDSYEIYFSGIVIPAYCKD